MYLSYDKSQILLIHSTSCDLLSNSASRNSHLTKINILPIQKWRTTAMLKSSVRYISGSYCLINAKFSTKKQNHAQTQATWPKWQISKTQDGGRTPFWQWFYRYISAVDHTTLMKFGVLMQISLPRMARGPKMKILQIHNGRRPPYWKSYFVYISAILSD